MKINKITKEQFDNLLTKFSPVKDSMPIIQTGSKKTLKIIFASKKDERLIFLTYGFVSKFLSNNEIKLIPYNIKEFENIPSYLNDLYMLSDKTYYCVINMNVSKFVIEHMNNSWDPKQTPKTQKFFDNIVNNMSNDIDGAMDEMNDMLFDLYAMMASSENIFNYINANSSNFLKYQNQEISCSNIVFSEEDMVEYYKYTWNEKMISLTKENKSIFYGVKSTEFFEE